MAVDVFIITSDNNTVPSIVTNNEINMNDRDDDSSRDLELASQSKLRMIAQSFRSLFSFQVL